MRSNFTQRFLVLEYLKKHKGITSIEAIEKFGATRLSGIIYDLRASGLNIKSEWESGINRYGNHCSYVRYYLKDNETPILDKKAIMGRK